MFVVYLTEFSKETFKIAKAHGWHNQNYSDAHWSAMMLTELSEAIQAERQGFHTTPKAVCAAMEEAFPHGLSNPCSGNLGIFTSMVKGTVEEELADFVIRICDFVAMKGNSLFYEVLLDKSRFKRLSLTEFVTDLVKWLPDTVESKPQTTVISNIQVAISNVQAYLDVRSFDMINLLLLKQEYNKTRAYKHNNKLF